jgi:23S rRNA (adenine2503-C2)-methyltransferase
MMVSYRLFICMTRRKTPMSQKRSIKSLNSAQLASVLADMGQPKFRTKQIVEWLYGKGAASFDEMSNLPATLRESLAGAFCIDVPRIHTRQISRDGTRKYLLELSDGCFVETVGIPSNDGTHLTVCFSTQVGCPMGCVFCATGTLGFTRNLAIGEIYDQVRIVGDDFDMRVSNVVGMGQGEPFANYDNVLDALRLMNSSSGLEIGARHITVSTCGVFQGIERFMGEPEQFTLAISLHAAIQKTRDLIMPGVATQQLGELRELVERYTDKTGRRVTFEYALIKGVNDDEKHLDALIHYCSGLLCHVNLIPLNRIDAAAAVNREIFEPSDNMDRFVSRLEDARIQATVRNSRGSDIDGACGQLANLNI